MISLGKYLRNNPICFHKRNVFFLCFFLIGIQFLQSCGEYHEIRDDSMMRHSPSLTVLPKHEEEYAKLTEVRERYHMLALPKIDREHAQIHVRLGIIHFDSGNMVESRFNLERSIEMYHDIAGSHFYLGKVFIDNGDTQGAVKEFNTALAIDPKMIEVHKFLGDVYQKAGLTDKAEKEYDAYQKSKGQSVP